jgi:HlyD family secretion protein
LNDLKENASLITAQALQAVAVTDKALDQAGDRFSVISGTADQADIDGAHATMVMAQDKLEKAQEDFKPYEKKSEDNLTRAAFQARLASAQIAYDNAVTRYNNLAGRANQYELAVAETTQILAVEQLADAQREYEKVKDGPDPDQLALAEARLTTAEAALQAARAEPSSEALALAQAQVDAAQAAIDVLQTQLAKLSIYAPQDGIVLYRSAEPGENMLPGAPLLTLANIAQLTITVYLPEDRYGQVVLGDVAKLRVDSFPGEDFEATIIQIADQAEFTPRNVQTAEGRSTTVFAVKLRVENPEGKLKPGMPADVDFE